MSVRFATGLVVGKFCPLHRGHQRLLDTARAQCQRVLVISYTRPEFDRCEPERRERWLAGLYPDFTRLVLDDARLAAHCHARGLPVRTVPHNDAADDEHRRFVAWLCLELLDTCVDAVFTSEDYGDGFAAVLGECFSAHRHRPHAVRHVCVDRARRTVPVSATAIRRDPWAHRDFLAAQVYADLVVRIALLGGESSGKTTLAAALATHFDTAWVPEYGRELWEARDGRLEFADMLRIGHEQLTREQRLAGQACRWLFCDTTPLTTAFYSHDLFGTVDPQLQQLAERRYDHTLLCVPDIDFVQDGSRRDHHFRDRQHAWYLRELARRGDAFTVVEGTLAERVARVAAALETHQVNACDTPV